VTPDEWRSDYRIAEKVTSPGADVSSKASFVVEAGKPGARKI
jgi:alkaline phosphatase D